MAWIPEGSEESPWVFRMTSCTGAVKVQKRGRRRAGSGSPAGPPGGADGGKGMALRVETSNPEAEWMLQEV